MQVLLGLHPQTIFEENNKRWMSATEATGLPQVTHKDMLLKLSDIRSRCDKLAAMSWRYHRDEGTGVDLWRQEHAEDVFLYQPQTLGVIYISCLCVPIGQCSQRCT